MKPIMAIGFLGRKLFALALVLPVLGSATMALGGYFDHKAIAFHPASRFPRSDLVAVFFSGDMGLAMGSGKATVATLRAQGLGVLTVNSSALFRMPRDRAFVDALVADTLRRALAASGARRAVLVGSAFGANMLDTGLGAVPADLRARIAAVVLITPDTAVYFHAHPSGLFYSGAPDSDPRRTVRLLHGLPVTCIAPRGDGASLCHAPEMAGAHSISLDDTHIMGQDDQALARSAVFAALAPPAPMH